MSSQIYSRQYLQGLPEMKRRQTIENDVFRLFQQILQPLQNAALNGETRYLHDMSSWVAEKQQNDYQQMREQQMFRQNEEMRLAAARGTALPTKKKMQWDLQVQAQRDLQAQSGASSYELLAGLKEKFPDCIVSLQEDWVETRQDVRVLKKGILIDWS